MISLSVPWLEFVLRAVVVYLFLLAGMRLMGKKETAQMTPFDLILLLIISNAVQNSMNAGDTSLIGGLISAATLLGLNHLLSWLAYRNKKIEKLIEGEPAFIIRNGKLNRDIMKSESLTQMDLEAAIRQYGCETIDEVKWAVLENNGIITAKKK